MLPLLFTISKMHERDVEHSCPLMLHSKTESGLVPLANHLLLYERENRSDITADSHDCSGSSHPLAQANILEVKLMIALAARLRMTDAYHPCKNDLLRTHLK